jgi:dephospho-CoA kinase
MPANKIILGFVGDLASGKGTVCKYLQQKYGTPSYRFSTILRGVVDRVYIPQTRENLQKISQVLRENFGQDLLSKAIAKDAFNDPHELVTVEGIRRPTDITYLKTDPAFHLIYITADPKVRWERMVKRNENAGDDKKSFESFLKDEQAEADRLIKELGKHAEFTIYNDKTFKELYEQIEAILKHLRQR